MAEVYKMKKIQELAETKTDTTGIPSVTPEVWGTKVEMAAQALRVARQFCMVNQDLLQGGDIVHLPRDSMFTVASDIQSGLTEGAVITPTAYDSYDTLDLTPLVYYAATRIAEDVVEELKIDILKNVNISMAEVLAQKEDQDILTAAVAGAGNTVWGGDANSVASLADGDTLTVDLIADCVTELRVDNYKPNVLFVHPTQEGILIKDSQFVHAAEYGGNEVVRNGEIGKYLGLKIISTTNVPSQTGGSNGHDCIMLDSKHALALAVGAKVRVRSEFELERNAYFIQGRMKYAAGVLQANAVGLIRVTDA